MIVTTATIQKQHEPPITNSKSLRFALWCVMLFFLLTPTYARQLSDASTTLRFLQDENATATFSELTLRFSLWFPYFDENDYDDLENVVAADPTHPIRQAALLAVLDALCSEGRLLVMEYGGPDVFDPIVGQDLCLSRAYKSDFLKTTSSSNDNQRRRLQEAEEASSATSFGAPSILDQDPAVSINRRARDRLTWSIWTLRYKVLQIGDIYIQEALQNEPNLLFSELAESSTQAMEQVMQLNLDVVIMERYFDQSLAAALNLFSANDNLQLLGNSVPNPVLVHASPIRKELETFTDINSQVYSNNFYDPRMMSPMRISGIALLSMTFLAFYTLSLLAARRRSAIKRKEAALGKRGSAAVVSSPLDLGGTNNNHSILLVSPQGVEDMLKQSASPLALGVARTAPAILTPKTAVSNSFSPVSSPATNKRRFFSGPRSKSADDDASAAGSTLDGVAVAFNSDGSVESFVMVTSPAYTSSQARRFVSDDDDDDDDDEQENNQGGLMQLPQNLKM